MTKSATHATRITEIANVPAAVGPYSIAVPAGEFVFLSGQIPLDPATGQIVGGGIEEQTSQVLENINTILSHLGANLESVVKTTIFLQKLEHFSQVNAIYAEFFGESKPARSTVEVAALPLGALIEIEAVVHNP